MMVFFMKETRGSVLLSQKAKALNEYYEKLEAAGYRGVVFDADSTRIQRRIRWKVKSDEDRDSLLRMIMISCYRPFR